MVRSSREQTSLAQLPVGVVMDAIREGLFLVGIDGVIAAVNTSFALFVDQPREALVGSTTAELSARLVRLFGDTPIFESSEGTRLIKQYWPKRRDLTLLTAAVRLPDGEVVGHLFAFHDVTRERELDRLKDEFVSMVTHEVRTPLTSIRGSLGLLAAGLLGDMPEQGQRMLEIAVQNTDRLMRLINDVLDLERIQSGRVALNRRHTRVADVMTQAGEAMRSMAETSNVTLTVERSGATAYLDPDRILQVLINLLSNAIKFSPPGGAVRLSSACDGDELQLFVEDQGRGIPQDKLDSIFERFQQVDATDSREKGGSGLGLAICKTIVEQHGGRIWARSTPGHGSTFIVALQIHAELA